MTSSDGDVDVPHDQSDSSGGRIHPLAWVGLAAVALLAVGVLGLVFVAERTEPSRQLVIENESQQEWTQLTSLTGSTTTSPVRSGTFRVAGDMVGLSYSVDRISDAPCLFVVILRDGDGAILDAPVVARRPGVDAIILDAPPGAYYLEALGFLCNWSVSVNEAR